jgi:uncharacterized integral membrane protein
MDNDTRFVFTVLSLGLLGLGLVILSSLFVAHGKEVPPAIVQLLAAITGGLLAILPQWPRGR